MARTVVTLSAHIAWWLKPYLKLIALGCRITGKRPDMAKVTRVIERAITVRAVNA